MEASSLEKNLPDDDVGSDSILGGCAPLSWCGIVSLAGVIAVCIGGVATHPLQAIRFVSRLIPAEPGPSLNVVLCLVTIGCIVCMVPVWVPLCMVAGLIFGVPVGAAHMFVALWTGCTLSVMIGRYFFREPLRERLLDGDAFAYRFMWKFRCRERHRLSTSSSVLPFICDCFLHHAWKLERSTLSAPKASFARMFVPAVFQNPRQFFPERRERTLVSKL